MSRQFLTGHEVVVQACIDAGATHMFGYPITPGTEILTGWIKRAQENKNMHYLQTEDEIAAGFMVAGAIMAGEKAFTATAGPGTTLMQDAMSMADGMRLPFVVIVGQRGGPSSGTVIYSQQEVNLAIHGGNGEGLRLVYSPSDVKELYCVTRLAFNNAWKYRFPNVVLTDGYLLKTKQGVELDTDIENIEATPLVSDKTQKNIRNIYTFEEELYEELGKQKEDFDAMAKEVIKFESYKVESCEELIVAHGIVGAAAKDAVDELQKQGKKVGLFRPITLSPFPKEELNKLAQNVKRIVIVESSLGQLRDLVKQNLEVDVKIEGLYKPAVGIETEEIVKMFR
ncbi:MAG: thiamine pyrophosphate-binding protein [Candidatus Magasanikbacteria bacterium]